MGADREAVRCSLTWGSGGAETGVAAPERRQGC